MLYKYSELQNLSYTELEVPLTRYFHKYSNHRKEIKKLKTHEKDFLFYNISLFRNERNELAYDFASIDEASEFHFNKLILTYFENLDFDKPTRDHLNRVISTEQVEKDKASFDNYYDHWINQLETKKGKYLNVIHTELNKRIKELNANYENGVIKEAEYTNQTKKHYLTAFYIYYKVKLFFDGLTDKFVTLNVLGENFIINIYSFVHILIRHYFPSLNNGNSDRSLNDPLPFFDIENLPDSVSDFLAKYFDYNKTPLDSSKEYLLFSFKGDKYIIWIQYKSLEELNNSAGFEFRTLYKCKEKRDLDKFDGLKEHKVDSNLIFYF